MTVPAQIYSTLNGKSSLEKATFILASKYPHKTPSTISAWKRGKWYEE